MLCVCVYIWTSISATIYHQVIKKINTNHNFRGQFSNDFYGCKGHEFVNTDQLARHFLLLYTTTIFLNYD